MIVKEIQIECSAEKVYEYLTQPPNFVGLQPLVVEIGNIKEGSNELGQVYFDYYAVERLQFLGFIPYLNKITSRMTLLETNRQIRQEVKANLGIRLHQELRISPEGQTVHVSNTIDYQAPALLRAYTHQQIDKAHSYLMQELKRRMEA